MKKELPNNSNIKKFVREAISSPTKIISNEDLQELIANEDVSTDDIDNIYSYLLESGVRILDDNDENINIDIDLALESLLESDGEFSYNEETSDLEYEDYQSADDYAKSLKKKVPDISTSDLNIIQVYYQDIARYPLLTQEEELELAKKIEKGDKRARDKFISSNLRLVISIAKYYIGRGVDISDLIQEGNLGLLKAMEKYDYRSGNKFSTYATWWIRQRIAKYVQENSKTIKIPVHVSQNSTKIKKEIEILTKKLGREPTYEEIAEATNIPEEKIVHLLNVIKEVYSIDTPRKTGSGDKEVTLGDTIEDDDYSNRPEEILMREALKVEINKMLDTLTDREKRIMIMRYGLNGTPVQTLEYIGAELGITRERVRQIEKKVLRKLRHPTKSQYIRDFI